MPSVATPHGRGVHDSSKGFGSTHSILQRVVNGICSAQQSGYVSGKKKHVLLAEPQLPAAIVNA